MGGLSGGETVMFHERCKVIWECKAPTRGRIIAQQALPPTGIIFFAVQQVVKLKLWLVDHLERIESFGFT